VSCCLLQETASMRVIRIVGSIVILQSLLASVIILAALNSERFWGPLLRCLIPLTFGLMPLIASRIGITQSEAGFETPPVLIACNASWLPHSEYRTVRVGRHQVQPYRLAGRHPDSCDFLANCFTKGLADSDTESLGSQECFSHRSNGDACCICVSTVGVFLLTMARANWGL
jgi:hypothetical protein